MKYVYNKIRVYSKIVYGTSWFHNTKKKVKFVISYGFMNIDEDT